MFMSSLLQEEVMIVFEQASLGFHQFKPYCASSLDS